MDWSEVNRVNRRAPYRYGFEIFTIGVDSGMFVCWQELVAFRCFVVRGQASSRVLNALVAAFLKQMPTKAQLMQEPPLATCSKNVGGERRGGDL